MNKNELHNIDWDIITDILNESASESQKKDFEKWINSDESNRTYFNQFKKVWLKTGSISHLHTEETNTAWEFVKSQTIQKQRKTIDLRSKVLLPLSIAASLFIVLFLGKDFVMPKETMISTTNQISLAYNLPDNSEIDLSYNSDLRFNSRFNKKTREVWLSGEAFFDVEKNKEKPFIIHTSHGDFKVLGTSFNISSYESDNILSLHVKTGLVEFFPKNKKGSVKIGKGYQIFFDKNKLRLIKKTNKTENYVAWKTKSLTFKNTKLDEVIKTLESTYNKTIIIENDALKDLSFTANFNNQSLEKIVKVITITFDIEAEYTNEKITIKPKKTPTIN